MNASHPLSLDELQTLIRQGIDKAHPLPYWVTAEISEKRVNVSGHCYLELVEKGGANHVPKAKASAVIWRSQYAMIASYFRSTTGQELQAGMKVLVKVVVSYHALYGLSLQITDIDPAYTLGDMERQRLETIQKLHEDGVYDMNRELPLPCVMQRIAVVSSPRAAGYQDFMRELSAGTYRFEVTLFEAFMQGNGAEDSIVEALGRAAERYEEFDVLVMIRGGGSQSDLGCFNSYRLCSYLAQFPLPVLTGIGHDKDQSVADLVAAVALKTPTAVAVSLKDRMEQFEGELDASYRWLSEATRALLHSETERLERAMTALNRLSESGVRTALFRMEQYRDALRHAVAATIERQGARVELSSTRLHHATRFVFSNGLLWIDHLREMLVQRSRDFLNDRSRSLALFEERIAAHDPRRILELGFAIVRGKGRRVADSEALQVGDTIEVEMKNRKLEAVVEKIES